LILDGAKALKAITAVAITITVATLTTALERIFATRMSSLKVEFEEMILPLTPLSRLHYGH
jgi:hypothetical protein